MSYNADQTIETFNMAAEENLVSALRKQQVVHLPEQGQVWMTGDIHDHRRNFDRLVRAANLGKNPDRHLVLHELIHGDHIDANGAEDSWQTLLRAAELKCDFPEQVHFLLANHDLAQIHGEGILKGGLSVCEAFNAGIRRDFGEAADDLIIVITEFLLSLPLAIKTHSGLLFCHSLPTDEQISKYDYTVFDRPLTGPDYRRKTGPVYQLIWGRNMSPAGVTEFLTKMNSKLVVTGHQPQESGYAINGPQHLIIASDHAQGVYLPLDLSVDYDIASMGGCLRRLVSLAEE